MAKPPEGYKALMWARADVDTPFNTIGVCVDHLEPTKSRGTDYTSQIILHDPSWQHDRGMKFRFFSGQLDRLPTIQANGDVVILHQVKTKIYNHQSLGMSNTQTTWLTLSGSSILESTCVDGSDIKITGSCKMPLCPAPTVEELRYVKEIVKLEDPLSYRPPPKSTTLEVENRMIAAGGTPSQRPRKRKRIEELVPSLPNGGLNFADLFGEVRKTWFNDCKPMDLQLTDYTTNKLLYSYAEDPQSRDGDEFGYNGTVNDKWPGPWGRMTIGVLLYGAHAEYTRAHVKPGMYIMIKNCHIKLDPNGSKLEAVCRTDRADTSKINVTIYKPQQAENDEEFRNLLRRRQEYERIAKAKGLRFGFSKEGQPRSNVLFGDTTAIGKVTDDMDEKPTKKQFKRRRRDRAKNKPNTNPTEETASNDAPSIQANQYVRCNNISVPLKSISSILDTSILRRKTLQGAEYHLPFQNCAYKSKVRVVDYYPPSLADFAVPYRVSQYDVLSQESTFDDDNTIEAALTASRSNPHTVRWEWRFFLVVEDAGPRTPLIKDKDKDDTAPQQMVLLVADKDAEYLLNIDPTDLRNNPRELAKLREKLFVLWGDLQERKEEAEAEAATATTNLGNRVVQQPPAPVKPQSKPFECFIKEFGVPVLDDNDNIDNNNTHRRDTRGENNQDTMPDEIHGSKHPRYQRMFRIFGTTV